MHRFGFEELYLGFTCQYPVVIKASLGDEVEWEQKASKPPCGLLGEPPLLTVGSGGQNRSEELSEAVPQRMG